MTFISSVTNNNSCVCLYGYLLLFDILVLLSGWLKKCVDSFKKG